ncbi:MAG: hypothetical protein KDB22_09750 [Planctomycetales bacterium]|nr:hypothetical protein [Planctomycetales bacterium]
MAKRKPSFADSVVAVAQDLCRGVEQLDFSAVPWVYNPLRYAWKAHEQYLRRYARPSCRVVFLGMNPGPWGMAQTGIPFGEIAAVTGWLGIDAPIEKPAREHPKRPIEGLACRRSEVSGRRLWGLFGEKFTSAEAFFDEFFVYNYCPLVFMEETARNVTPDKLPIALRRELETICDQHLNRIINLFDPQWMIGVGGFAEKCILRTLQRPDREKHEVRVGRILHPSPASPAANRDWSSVASKQLRELQVWA